MTYQSPGAAQLGLNSRPGRPRPRLGLGLVASALGDGGAVGGSSARPRRRRQPRSPASPSAAASSAPAVGVVRASASAARRTPASRPASTLPRRLDAPRRPRRARCARHRLGVVGSGCGARTRWLALPGLPEWVRDGADGGRRAGRCRSGSVLSRRPRGRPVPKPKSSTATKAIMTMHEDQHHRGVGDQLLAGRPDDLAELRDDLAVEQARSARDAAWRAARGPGSLGVAVSAVAHLRPSIVGLPGSWPCCARVDRSRLRIDTADTRCAQGRRDSNPQPPVLETGTLPIELLPFGGSPSRPAAVRRAPSARSGARPPT